MQNSPQEIKSRLDKAVDPEGNVLDMVAVLELVTTLERLPLTREALETTRIGKTINLLRKKTNNSELAKRAKKLVKKWQKLVINQLEATRNVDSPLNGSRVASPQINGAVRDGRPLSTDKLIKDKVNEGTKKGLKRKRSTSSLSNNSPLTLSQDTSPCTPSDNSSNPSSPFISITTSDLLAKDTSQDNNSKRQKLTVDLKEKNGDTTVIQTTVNKVTECDGKSTSNSKNSIMQDVNININNAEDLSETQTQDSNLGTDSFHNDSGIGSLESNVYTPLSSQQLLTPNQESNNTIMDSFPDKYLVNEMKNDLEHDGKENSQHSVNLIAQNGLQNNEKMGESATSLSKSPVNNSNLPEDIDTTINTANNLENLQGTEIPKEMLDENKVEEDEGIDNEKMEEESREPKEFVLDIDQEANGINGRYNEQGIWYSWLDMMPCNDGNLNILPYVILD